MIQGTFQITTHPLCNVIQETFPITTPPPLRWRSIDRGHSGLEGILVLTWIPTGADHHHYKTFFKTWTSASLQPPAQPQHSVWDTFGLLGLRRLGPCNPEGLWLWATGWLSWSEGSNLGREVSTQKECIAVIIGSTHRSWMGYVYLYTWFIVANIL